MKFQKDQRKLFRKMMFREFENIEYLMKSEISLISKNEYSLMYYSIISRLEHMNLITQNTSDILANRIEKLLY